MKKLLCILTLWLVSVFAARAQVLILNENVYQGRMSEIKATVLDSLTNQAVGYASVYVIPSKDTTITNFTLTDADGRAKLDEVPFGSYFFHVEMMGYKPFVKERYFREKEVDMGTIRLQVDELFLQAAVVSDVGNPIVVKQDTVEFNASSFRVGANAMLKDLIKRMPGMEITEDGKVKFNGQEIDKLTVGGRTFFFNDQSTALNNLPAAVVDKIRVIDRESEQTRATGIQDGNREKVLDVALKKEYEKGWFGNVGLKGGTTLGKKGDADALRDNRGLLWSGNVLASAYSEKDQLTVIANGQNINDSNVVMVMIDEDGERTRTSGQGLSTAAQLAVNVNTSRIKDVETTVGANYKYTDTDTGTRSLRTTYQDDGNLTSAAESGGKSYAHGLNANAEFKKENGKVQFHIRPTFRYNSQNDNNYTRSETLREGVFLNSSDNTSYGQSRNKSAMFDSDVVFRELGGKTNRSLSLALFGMYSDNSGESAESTVLTTAAGKEARNMTYQTVGDSYRVDGSFQYTEPVGEKWTLIAGASLGWTRRGNLRDAFDAAGRNDYYSSETRTLTLQQQYDLRAQYQLGTSSYILFGGRVYGILNETYSKSYGIEDVTGKGEWNWYVAPTFRFVHNQGNDRLTVNAVGYSRRPSNAQMLPVLNIGNPSRLSLGNVYLKPYSYTSLTASWSRNNREKFSTLIVYLNGQVNYRPIVSALWYDAAGILYSVPVNARRPSLTSSLWADYTVPLDQAKLWSLTLMGSVDYASFIGYQARTTMAALDKESFDYSAFMDGFWGSADGDRFYGGQSGFEESRTRSFNPSAEFTVKYNADHYSISAGAGTQGRIARYSLSPQTNLNTLDTWFTLSGSYTTQHEFELESDLSYQFYKGYAAGYDQPEWNWNAEVSKSIGAFNLSVKVHDILNQTRSLRHTVTDNYQEDSYRLRMGRYILFGVKWNFGKMNAAHSARARQAALRMVY